MQEPLWVLLALVNVFCETGLCRNLQALVNVFCETDLCRNLDGFCRRWSEADLCSNLAAGAGQCLTYAGTSMSSAGGDLRKNLDGGQCLL